ncbi:MAG: ComEC/Rec2 family competence protein [Candidatus Puniceispirillaceae bacterium]
MPKGAVIGAVVEMRARLFPPPRRILPGTPDFSRNARIADIAASGFVTSDIHVVAPPSKLSAALFLGGVRANLAATLHRDLKMPAGGIAAALIVGDRRFISDLIYDLFRASGLAHLLAISGLHVGLLCFGCMAALRFFAALFPKMASRMAVHKYAAVISVLIGLIYVILSGASVSAVRAFIMALLVIFAVLIDRRALTIRNVALAAFVILAINPVAVFGAGFQLSFAATAVLVMAYEKSLYRPPARRHRIIGYLIGIFAASVLANFATAPFKAQYFGSFTPWGVLANMIAIPLTGFWIMPSALLYMMALPLGLDSVIGPVFASGILAVIEIAAFFAKLPFADTALSPPGYVVLMLLVGGIAVSYTLVKPMHLAGWGLATLAILLWIMKPVPDAVLFAENRKPTLVVASANGHLASYGQLSDFLMDMAALRLGQKHAGDSYQNCDGGCRHQLRSGQLVAIVTKRHGLSAACDDPKAAFIISMTPPLYPCRSTNPIYYFTQRIKGNYLLFINKTRIIFTTNNSVSGQLACLAPQPRPC